MVLKKKSAQGVGTLIIFIALILVAAIAASVLIQTSSNLQSKSLDVGNDAQGRVSNSLDIIQVRGVNASDNVIDGSGVDSIYIMVRLSAGSEDMRLTDLVINLNSPNGAQTLTNDQSASITSFNQTYLSGTPLSDGYISKNEVAELRVPVLYSIGENEKVNIKIIPSDGLNTDISFTTDSVMRLYNQVLYP